MYVRMGAAIWIGIGLAAGAAAQETAPRGLTWDGLGQRLEREAGDGWSGAALVVRNNEIVLSQGYGMANQAQGTPCTPTTIFAIGSTPIDFTKAALLLLIERGKVRLEDPITKYFKDVPEDKRAITLLDLATGSSGLPDFHDVPSDRDPDHGWIDRAEMERRILGAKLLFAPGTDRAHSHSAWGLLTAIVEIASGQSYQDFTREHLFKPAGMKDTGFFGEPIPAERLAIGYGPKSDGEINAPPYWGPTSWLVMGSGGMTSTTMDMHRWLQALRTGKLLSKESQRIYWSNSGAVLSGGDMYGFEIRYTEGPGTYMVLISNNSRDSRTGFEQLAREVGELVSGETRPKFMLGVMLTPAASGLRVDQVVEGGAAKRDGLQSGDILLSGNGQPLGTLYRSALDELLTPGKPIRFEVERAGQRKTVEVKPNPR